MNKQIMHLAPPRQNPMNSACQFAHLAPVLFGSVQFFNISKKETARFEAIMWFWPDGTAKITHPKINGRASNFSASTKGHFTASARNQARQLFAEQDDRFCWPNERAETSN